MYALPLGAVGAVVSAGISREKRHSCEGGKKKNSRNDCIAFYL